MPTYGYRCSSCGTEFDVRQRMSDEAGASCPQCGQPAKRLFFAPAIVFNGAGFYKTDSRKASKAGASKGKSSAATDTSSATPSAAPAASTAGAGSSTAATEAASAPSPSTD
jgi:putative FmdB family regulatory protein